MSLRQIFEGLRDQVTSVVGALEKTTHNTPDWQFGAQHLSDNAAPPRVIMIPTQEEIRGPHALGGDGIKEPRPLYTRHSTVVFHIWGESMEGDHNLDFDVVEEIANHVVAACTYLFAGAHRVISGSWNQSSSNNNLGQVYLLEVEFLIPFTREPSTFSKPIATIPITGTIVTS